MSQPLFGLIPAGQPVIVAPTQMPTPTSFLFAIPPAPPTAAAKPFSHIVVFLLPGVVLPAGTAAAIYLVTPPTDPTQTEPNSRFLGGIGPGKESAIFKLSPPTTPTAAGSRTASAAAPTNNVVVVIGISLEPAESVAARIPPHPTTTTAAAGASSSIGGALVPAPTTSRPLPQQQPPGTLVLAQRIIKNAFNFLASFSGTMTAPGPGPGGGGQQVEVVPLKAFEEWWRKFENRLRTDPGFLERDD